DTEAEPVGREFGEAREACAGEGHAVVRAHGRGDAVGPKRLLADISRGFIADSAHALATHDAPAEMVGDRQRVAIAAIAQPKLALVVDAPDLVGNGRLA